MHRYSPRNVHTHRLRRINILQILQTTENRAPILESLWTFKRNGVGWLVRISEWYRIRGVVKWFASQSYKPGIYLKQKNRTRYLPRKICHDRTNYRTYPKKGF